MRKKTSQSTSPSPKYLTVRMTCRHYVNQIIDANIISNRYFKTACHLKDTTERAQYYVYAISAKDA